MKIYTRDIKGFAELKNADRLSAHKRRKRIKSGAVRVEDKAENDDLRASRGVLLWCGLSLVAWTVVVFGLVMWGLLS